MKLIPTSAAIMGLADEARSAPAQGAVLDLYVVELADLFDAMDLAPLREREKP